MGRLLPFRRPPRPRRPRRGRFASVRTLLLLVVLLVLYALSEPALVPAEGIFEGGRERVAGPFSPCGRGRLHACVVDGDTIKLGERKVRLIGIDAPERFAPECRREAALAEQASAELLRLLNRGPVVLVTDRRDTVDRYGRELRRIVQWQDGRGEVDVGEELVAQGLATRWAGFDAGWCRGGGDEAQGV